MPRTLICAKCGASFECSGTADCWCASVKVDDRVLAELEKQTRGCVCRKCLEE